METKTKIPTVKLGSEGLEVSKLGFGCGVLVGFYGSLVSEEVGISIIKHAFHSGVTFFDTSDLYGPHTNEILVGEALKQLPRDKVQLATKFGVTGIDETGMTVNGKPEYVRACCEASLQRLGVDYIDLYYQHRVDKAVPIEDTIGEMKKLVEEGKVKYIGLSEASADTIKRAHAVHPITAVQMEWSLWTRDIEEEIVPRCRFMGENLEKNKAVYARIEKLAAKYHCTTAQLALSWLLYHGDDVVPIPGTTKIKNLDDNIGSLEVKLTEEDLKEISAAASIINVAGSRSYSYLESYDWNNANTPSPDTSAEGFPA